MTNLNMIPSLINFTPPNETPDSVETKAAENSPFDQMFDAIISSAPVNQEIKPLPNEQSKATPETFAPDLPDKKEITAEIFAPDFTVAKEGKTEISARPLTDLFELPEKLSPEIAVKETPSNNLPEILAEETLSNNLSEIVAEETPLNNFSETSENSVKSTADFTESLHGLNSDLKPVQEILRPKPRQIVANDTTSDIYGEKPKNIYGEKPVDIYGEKKPRNIYGEKPINIFGEKPKMPNTVFSETEKPWRKKDFLLRPFQFEVVQVAPSPKETESPVLHLELPVWSFDSLTKQTAKTFPTRTEILQNSVREINAETSVPAKLLNLEISETENPLKVETSLETENNAVPQLLKVKAKDLTLKNLSENLIGLRTENIMLADTSESDFQTEFTPEKFSPKNFELSNSNQKFAGVNSASEQISAEFSNVLREKILSGKDSHIVRLRLNPEELGTVEIRLETTKTGEINAKLSAEHDTTRQMLTANLAQLRENLQNNGWEINRLEVVGEGFSANADSQQSNRQTPSETSREKNRPPFSASNEADGAVSASNSNQKILSVLA